MLLLANAPRATKSSGSMKMDCNERMLRCVRVFKLSHENMTSMLTG